MGVLFIYGKNGIRKAVMKTVPWTVFRPWENPGAFDGTPVGVLAKVTYPGTLHSANFSHPCQKRYLT